MNFFSLFSTNSILISFSFVLFTKHQIRFIQYLFAMDCKIKNVFVFFFASFRIDANKTLECCIYICRWNMFVYFHYFHMEKFSTKNTILLLIASSIVFVFFFRCFLPSVQLHIFKHTLVDSTAKKSCNPYFISSTNHRNHLKYQNFRIVWNEKLRNIRKK